MTLDMSRVLVSDIVTSELLDFEEGRTPLLEPLATTPSGLIGLTHDEGSDRLWGVTADARLLAIDPATRAVESSRPIIVPGRTITAAEAGDVAWSTFDATLDAITEFSDPSASTTAGYGLYAMDVTTGVASRRGPWTDQGRVSAMDFLGSSLLALTKTDLRLLDVDTLTGSPTLVQEIAPGSSHVQPGMDFIDDDGGFTPDRQALVSISGLSGLPGSADGLYWLGQSSGTWGLDFLAAAFGALSGLEVLDQLPQIPNPLLTIHDGADTISAHDGDDLLFGDDALEDVERAILIGGPGDDRLDASAFTAGPVTLLGGDGDDTLNGDDGDNRIVPLGGHDTIGGGGGNVAGRGGDDRLVADDGGATDEYDGGDGNEAFDLSQDPSITRSTLNLQAGNGSIGVGGPGGLTLILAGLENVLGSDGDDEIIGDAGDNRIDARAGNDTNAGGDGSDLLDGNAGSDVIVGTSTAYDAPTLANQNDWAILRDAWNDDRNVTLGDRVMRLLDTGTPFASGDGILDDGSPDFLIGDGSEPDWFLRNLTDAVSGAGPGSQCDLIG